MGANDRFAPRRLESAISHKSRASLSRRRVRDFARDLPGEHTGEVLGGDLGLDAAELNKLHHAGLCGGRRRADRALDPRPPEWVKDCYTRGLEVSDVARDDGQPMLQSRSRYEQVRAFVTDVPTEATPPSCDRHVDPENAVAVEEEQVIQPRRQRPSERWVRALLPKDALLDFAYGHRAEMYIRGSLPGQPLHRLWVATRPT